MSLSEKHPPEIHEYDTTNLSPDMLEEIQHLEEKLKNEGNEQIILIAYSKNGR